MIFYFICQNLPISLDVFGKNEIENFYVIKGEIDNKSFGICGQVACPPHTAHYVADGGTSVQTKNGQIDFI